MALSVDSALYRCQHLWCVKEPSQSQLESARLLSSDYKRQKYDFDKWRIVFPSNEKFQKESSKVSQCYS